AGGDDVELLDRVLADVTQPERPGGRVEAEPERVAKPECPDLVSSGHADERVSRGGRTVQVEPEHLAFERVHVLRVGIGGGTRRPAVPEAGVADPRGGAAVPPDPQ